MALTADTFATKVARRCFWPTTNAPLSTSEILAIGDEEISGDLWPQILASQGDYYLGKLDQAITADVARYRMPNRAYGPIREVVVVDDDGLEYDVPLINIGDLGAALSSYGATSSGVHHYIDGDFIGLWPVPDATDHTLRVRYYRHPNELVLVASALQVTSIAALAGGDLVFASNPDTLWNVGDKLDVVSNGNAHQILADEYTIASFPNATTLRFSATLTGSGIQVGDWVTLTGYTPVVQVPDFMVPALIRRTAQGALEAFGDEAGALREGRAAKRLEERAQATSIPRSEAESRVVVPRNSPLRLMMGARR